jgi:cystathionine beta-lyase
VPESGFLAWLDISSLNIGENPAANLIKEQRVAFVPGRDLGKQYDQYVRINFACHPDSLKRAIQALAAYVK